MTKPHTIPIIYDSPEYFETTKQHRVEYCPRYESPKGYHYLFNCLNCKAFGGIVDINVICNVPEKEE